MTGLNLLGIDFFVSGWDVLVTSVFILNSGYKKVGHLGSGAWLVYYCFTLEELNSLGLKRCSYCWEQCISAAFGTVALKCLLYNWEVTFSFSFAAFIEAASFTQRSTSKCISPFIYRVVRGATTAS